MKKPDYKKIAIVGSGISGLVAAHMLHRDYDITVFEANNYIGGHTNTVRVDEGKYSLAIDTGFIVFNDKTYPNFLKLINKLKVPTLKSNMSFSYTNELHNHEYGGASLNALFSDRKQILKPNFYKFLIDITSFNRRCKKTILEGTNRGLHTLRSFVEQGKYGSHFYTNYLRPMASAIWSTPTAQIDDMPIEFFLDFFENHGLLDIRNRPTWYVIKNGSCEYIKKLVRPFSDKILVSTPVLNIKRTEQGIQLSTSSSDNLFFDAVVMACHSDQALKLLESPTKNERDILANIPYSRNTAILHTDINALPKHKRTWSSWNFIEHSDGKNSLTYHMNKLQSLRCSNEYCVSINNNKIKSDKIIKTFEYEHPLYTVRSVHAKEKHKLINGLHNTYYVGAYWNNGFHEDGVKSCLTALKDLRGSL